ncbi:MAG: HAMP domain-containing histidine kinase [Bacteroidetes bacterium]|nr:HAMP domain-containing histidine kinase [Bacteroidota bacterium]
MEKFLSQPLAIVCLLLAMLLSVFLYVIKSNASKIVALQKELTEKKEALQYSMLQLESSKTELKNSLAFRERAISIVVHDLKSPLAFLYRIISHLHVSHTKMNSTDLEKLTSEMSHTTYQIVGFVNDLLDWLNSNQLSFSLQSDIKPFNDFILAKCAVYSEIANKKGLKFELKAKPDFLLRADFNLLQIVVRNLLDNAIKHTEAGSISINGYADELHQYIVITDTGTGISNDKAMELEYGVITKKTNESSQIGFRIVYDMVVKMNGKIKIRQQAGGGTAITVILPK